MSQDGCGKRWLYCHCAYAKVVPAGRKREVLDGLGASPRDFHAVPDLCELAVGGHDALREFAGDGELGIVACYPRAVRWLFHKAGVALDESVPIVNMRTQEASQVLEELERVDAGLPLRPQESVDENEGEGAGAAAIGGNDSTESSSTTDANASPDSNGPEGDGARADALEATDGHPRVASTTDARPTEEAR